MKKALTKTSKKHFQLKGNSRVHFRVVFIPDIGQSPCNSAKFPNHLSIAPGFSSKLMNKKIVPLLNIYFIKETLPPDFSIFALALLEIAFTSISTLDLKADAKILFILEIIKFCDSTPISC